ncbi:MAG: bifunctional DNA-formamidopyrimidine glycosylase/DNA-(apurinic or apyrimidinic site) lyase [Candidatus Eremiobacteraeota bacterium]|nr:bifunctional DNA-formamidopyrimidine glycosylase/DNA-(apurinic or apyrimidinic site) lyase [Candidatus Eremiobacteraeota bacterium]
MPELPEVETIARDLAPLLRGRRVMSVRAARRPPVFEGASLAPRLLRNRRIDNVGRAGKFIVLELDDQLRLAVHLRMTGNLLYHVSNKPVPYTRATFELDNGARLIFADVRKFGRMRIFVGDARAALGVGVDPFDKELDANRFGQLSRGRKVPVKVWLLDQKRLAGVGNIYACESLFYARLRPKRRVGKLSLEERSRLLVSLRRVLRRAIRHRGSSIDDYVDAEGKEGEFQKQLSVYGRAGMPCRRCGTPIRRIVLAQRGTFYCPVCQR